MVCSTISTSKSEVSSLRHHTHCKSVGWQRRTPRDKPYVKLAVEFDENAARALDMIIPDTAIQSVTTQGMADTGASVCMADNQVIKRMGLDTTHLTKCSMELTSADKSSIRILGAIPVVITDISSGLKSSQILYISNNASSLLLSLEACIDLHIVPDTFPAFSQNSGNSEAQQIGRNGTNSKSQKKHDCECNCPIRTEPPKVPDKIPFAPIEENVPALEKWLREKYAASAFNCCECQPLPKMHGPPLKIFMKEGVKPVAAHTPIPIPLHWQKQVKAGLDRDEVIGVIEKVPSGTPTTWCHRMVVVPKKDNTPRRTVNFMPLNEHSTRQTHHTIAPFHQASMVPSNTKKTVLDAWNGYHSVYLDPECRDLTTFITPWGRYRYKTAPQGYLAAGDAYTERFDKIISEVKNKTKCVDDTVLW